jgi:hypothetical protein
MADFDGVAKKAKTKGKQLGTSGPTVPEFTGKGGSGGKRNIDMKTMGRNLAKVAAQKRGSSRGR